MEAILQQLHVRPQVLQQPQIMSEGSCTTQAPSMAPVSPVVVDTSTTRDVRTLCTALPLPLAPWLPSTCEEGMQGLCEKATIPTGLVTEACRQRVYGLGPVHRPWCDALCA